MKKIVEARETPRGKVREIAGLSAPINKIVHPTYLSNNDESLIFAAYKIEGGHGLPLDIHALLDQLQIVAKGVN